MNSCRRERQREARLARQGVSDGAPRAVQSSDQQERQRVLDIYSSTCCTATEQRDRVQPAAYIDLCYCFYSGSPNNALHLTSKIHTWFTFLSLQEAGGAHSWWWALIRKWSQCVYSHTRTGMNAIANLNTHRCMSVHTNTPHELRHTQMYIMFWAWMDKAFECVQTRNIGSTTFRMYYIYPYILYNYLYYCTQTHTHTCMLALSCIALQVWFGPATWADLVTLLVELECRFNSCLRQLISLWKWLSWIVFCFIAFRVSWFEYFTFIFWWY